jgi:broad specificity phosphatase PhoE
MAEARILLMRHGAGIKPGQDPEKVPRAADGVLTAVGHREAQAVGHTLAETSKSSYPLVRRAAVLYSVPPAGREPEATATAVARQLQAAGIRRRRRVPRRIS